MNTSATTVAGIDHVTLRCSAAQLAPLQQFYEQVIGLRTGPRPSFDFAGAWLYAGETAVLHLAAVLEEPTSAATGFVDHFALRATGAVNEVRDRLTRSGIAFSEAPVPGWPLFQIFVNDPLGVKVELNFAVSDTGRRSA